MELRTRNINTAFSTLVGTFAGTNGGVPRAEFLRMPSRNGDVIRIKGPVSLIYEKPTERVLQNVERDCNPFFHLYEALWMLAGRNDLEPLLVYNSKMGQFSDDGKTLNGAYGYRWRHAYHGAGGTFTNPIRETDQIQKLLYHLQQEPLSRRAVLQMWTVEDDLLKMKSKDICCNTNIYFELEPLPCSDCGLNWLIDKSGACVTCAEKFDNYALNMTVCNRSNDVILGMLGANVVHMSLLQEYMAAHLMAEVGTYTQFTNNCHVYTEAYGYWDPEKLLKEYRGENVCDICYPADPRSYVGEGVCDRCGKRSHWLRNLPWQDLYAAPETKLVPLVQQPFIFNLELPAFVELYGSGDDPDYGGSANVTKAVWQEPFLETVAKPALNAYRAHKQKNREASYEWAGRIEATDWRAAAEAWLKKRASPKSSKDSGGANSGAVVG